MKQIRSIVVVALLTAFTGPAAALDEGTIKGNRVNVRAQAKLESEVVVQLNDGDRVTIIDEVSASKSSSGGPKNFYKIILPTSATAWVSAKYVKDGAVTATRLNVRAGAGERFSVLGRIKKGTTVEQVKIVGDWMEIRPAGGLHGYVASSLVKADTAPPAVVEKTPSPMPVPPSVPVVESPIVPVPPPAETLEVVSVESAAPIVPEPVSAAPMPVATTPVPSVPEIPGGVYSETTVKAPDAEAPAPQVRPNELLTPPPAEPETESAHPVYKVVQPSKKKTMLGRWWERLTTRNVKDKPVKPAGKFHEPPAPAEEGPPVVRTVTREGIVVRAWNIQAPSDWALKEVYTGKIVNYLWAGKNDIPWKDLRGRTVIITGEEAIDPRWQRTPVLHIETLKTVDEDGDGEG